MMEFYSEQEHKAQKEHICELCEKAIRQGDQYYRETGKYNGVFFDRALHVQCHLMEEEYCFEVESEFTWDSIEEYIEDKYCSQCDNYDADESDCRRQYRVTECPKILKHLLQKEDNSNE